MCVCVILGFLYFYVINPPSKKKKKKVLDLSPLYINNDRPDLFVGFHFLNIDCKVSGWQGARMRFQDGLQLERNRIFYRSFIHKSIISPDWIFYSAIFFFFIYLILYCFLQMTIFPCYLNVY